MKMSRRVSGPECLLSQDNVQFESFGGNMITASISISLLSYLFCSFVYYQWEKAKALN